MFCDNITNENVAIKIEKRKQKMEENIDGQFTLFSVQKEDSKNKKIAIIILCLIALVLLIFTIQNCIRIINGYKVYEQYELQLNILEYKEKQKAIEEKRRQEKIPKLTQKRYK